MTKRSLKKKRFTDFFIDNQMKPCLRVSINFTYQNDKLKLMTFDIKLALLIIRLNGRPFNRFYKLMIQLFKLYTQAKALLLPQKSEDFRTRNHASGSNQAMVTLRISNVNSDLILENIPELISTFSQSYVSKILSLLLKDVSKFYVRFTPLSIERRYASNRLGKLVMDHYISQGGTQLFNSISGSDMMGNP